jgi:signal transduction histidine kinase
MLRREPRSPAERQSLVEPALHAARTCMELTRQLVDFSRRPEGKQSVVNVAEALRSVLPMLKGAATPAVDLDLRIDWPVWGARLDPHALDAAIVNLLVNARDAMPSGGRAEITIRNRVLTEPLETRLETIPPGTYVECAIADSGVGIPDEALDKVVEPFFTTKTINGTGLGLSNVYNFVRAMDGHMVIESMVGEGTRIALLFPAVVGETLEHDQHEAGAPRSAG